MLANEDVKKELERLQNAYVLVPIDKASNNIGFICKHYFIRKIIDEICTDTYRILQEDPKLVVNRLKETSEAVLGIHVDNEHMQLPSMHMTIKKHKNPTKFRFIVASKRCPTKHAAKILTKILAFILGSHRRFCNKIKAYTGINRMWVCDNNQSILSTMDATNNRHQARNIATYDFSTLYTKINLTNLKERLKWCTAKAFKGGNNTSINVSDQQSHVKWGENTKGKNLNKQQVFDLIDFVVDTAYFQIGTTVYQQVIGIPMGIDPAPFMANLYLYSYEYEFMERMTATNYGVAKAYNKTHRFIDDLGTLNNNGRLGEQYQQIYPPELILNKENANDTRATFLDMDITVDSKQFITKLYDKRDKFGFDIVSYPDLSGNIPTRPAYGVFTAQIIRIARVCTKLIDCTSRVKTLIERLLRQGFDLNMLSTTARKCLNKNAWITDKYQRTTRHILYNLWDL